MGLLTAATIPDIDRDLAVAACALNEAICDGDFTKAEAAADGEDQLVCGARPDG